MARLVDLGGSFGSVFTTRAGSTWVAYTDQWIFGARNARPGVVRFDADFEPDWSYGGDQYLGQMADCYALSLVGETAWICYYPGFPVGRLDPPHTRTWEGDASGATTLVVDEPLIALVGGYAEHAHRVVIGELEGNRFTRWQERTLCLPDGSPLDPGTRLVGRDSTLHAVEGETWLRLELADAL